MSFFLTTIVMPPSAVEASPLEDQNGTLAAVSELTADLAPGQWQRYSLQMPLVDRATHDAVVAQFDAPLNAWGRTGSDAVLSAWNSAAYDDADNRLFLMGGGHADYGGNEVYALDFDTLQWQRLTDPAPLLREETDAIDGSPVYLPESTPPAGHTYDGLSWNPVSQTLWLTTHTSFNLGVTHVPERALAWEFDPATLEWTAHATASNHTRPTSAFVEDAGGVLSIHGTSSSGVAARLIHPDGTVLELGNVDGPANSQIAHMFVDPVSGTLYEAHQAGIFRVDLDLDAGRVTSEKIADYPDDFLGSLHQAGFAYHPGDAKFYSWSGGERVIAWDPASGEFELLWNERSEEAPAPADLAVGRIFDKWVYLEEADVFAGVQGKGEIWFYRAGDNPPDIDQANVGELVADPATAHSLNVFVPLLSGDRDYDATVQVYVRESGGDEWSRALDLLRIRPELFSTSHGVAKPAEGFAGSVFGLEPDTAYEIRLEIADPDGLAGPATLSAQLHTAALPSIDPVSARQVPVSDMAGLQAVAGAAQPGDVILLQPGLYQGRLTIDASGTEDNPIVIRGLDRDSTLVDAGGTGAAITITGDHVHIENVTLQNAGTGIVLRGNTDGVVIRENYLTGVLTGIDAREGHTNLYIADNVLRGGVQFPDTSNATWNYEGIVVTGQGIEVARNTLSGFGDSLGMHHRSGGLENVSIDIHHNLVLSGGDDGIELDFALRNVQAHHNLIANTANGISFQPVWGGPAYAYQNVIYNTERGPYKINPENDSPSGIYILNNTSIRAGSAWENFSGYPSNLTILNNLFVSEGADPYVLVNESQNRLVELDYNAWSEDGLFRFVTASSSITNGANDFAQWQANSPHSQHGVLLAGEAIFEVLPIDFEESGFTVLRDPLGADFTLHPQSSAIDAALLLAGVNDQFTGAAPDIGAWESGVAPPQYGARFIVTPPQNPFAIDDHAFVETGQTVSVDVLANDFEPDGDLLMVTEVGDAVHGVATLGPSGEVVFAPEAGYLGEASFTYVVRDPDGNTASASVTLTVTPPNSAPSANPDSISTVGGIATVIASSDLLGNDADPDDDALAITAVGPASHGTVSLLAGAVQYVPTVGFYGTDAFDYTAADGRGGTSSALVTVSVFPQGTIIGTPATDHIDLSGLTEGQVVAAGAGSDLVIGSDGDDTISGEGGTDTLRGGAGNDVFLVTGSGDGLDVVDGGAGVDTWRGTAGDDVFGVWGALSSIERVEGMGGYDVIRGHSGRDVIDLSATELTGIAVIEGDGGPDIITGSAGADVIAGGADTDYLYGGAGDDTFLVRGTGDGHDRIDGGAGSDTWLGTTGDDIFGVWTRVTGIEFIDGNGGNDIILGHDGTDVIDLSGVSVSGIALIDGAGGPDYITGSAGDDVIRGGGHTDRMDGGGGDDVFLVSGADDGFDLVIGGAGFDRWMGGAGDDVFGVWTQLEGLELIDGGGGSNVIKGHYGRDVIDLSNVMLENIAYIDGGGGHDHLIGSAGDDVFLGESGQDVVDGMGGFDTVEYDDDFDAFVVSHGQDDVVTVRHVGERFGTDTLNGVEALLFNDGNYDLSSRTFRPLNTAPNPLSDTGHSVGGMPVALDLLANDGDPDGDAISVLFVTAPNNGVASIADDGTVLYAPEHGFAGLDQFEYVIVDSRGLASAAAAVSITVTAPDVVGTPWRDVFDFSGSSSPRVIDVGAGSDIVTGSSGDDVITGGEGIDFLRGGDGNDTFLVAGANAGFDEIRGGTGDDAWLGSAGDDVFGIYAFIDSIEMIDGNGGYDIVVGFEGRDNIDFSNTLLAGIAVIEGRGGPDIIVGSAGADVIKGGAGTDYLTGGPGDDVFLVEGSNDGFDDIKGGDGFDTWKGSSGDDVFGVWASFSGLERIEGNGGTDVIRGHHGRDVLDFSGIELVGISAIEGGNGHDTIIGSQGNDYIDAGRGYKDHVFGGDGDDTLVFDASDQILDGGAGIDTLWLDDDQSVDLASLALRHLEKLDMRNDSGSNSVSLWLDDVLRLSDTGALRIDGDAGDSVQVYGAAISLGASIIGDTAYETFASGPGDLTRLFVQSDLSIDLLG